MAVLLQIKNAHKSYGDQVLLDGAEATLTERKAVSCSASVGLTRPSRQRSDGLIRINSTLAPSFLSPREAL